MKFQKGQSGNLHGRPPAPEKVKLREALEFEGKKRKKEFWLHVAEQAFEDNTILKEIVKKFVPDIKEMQLDVQDNRMAALILSALPPEIAEGVRLAIEEKIKCLKAPSNVSQST